MNKKFGKIAALACGATLAMGAFALTACNNGEVQYTGYGADYIVAHSAGTATYTFEAEYTCLENKEGPAFSGDYTAENMVRKGDSTASNDYVVCGMLQKGVTLNFIIVCDRDITNATLQLRLGNENEASFSITSDMFLVRVDPVSEEDTYRYDADNGGAWGSWDEQFLGYYYDSKTPVKQNEYGTQPFEGYYIEDYSPITVTATEQNPSGFEDYTVSTSLKLWKGLNCISLITNNDTIPNAGQAGSTLKATAPVVDAIKIKTDAQLGMYNPVKNQSYLDLAKACTVK